ncbi:MAG: hypothetical protein WDN06_02075 [Asticcacaulis sp.]
MIVTKDFVFLHLHKSGGTFINQMLLKCEPSARRLGYHLPYDQLPADFRHLPVLGTVRNPWAYYVSWYHFQKGQAHPNALFRTCSDEGRLDFAGTVSNLLDLSENAKLIAALAQIFPETFQVHGLNLTKACIARISGSGLGFYSFLYHRLYAGADRLDILRMETMRDDFRGFASTGLGRYFLDAAPAMNTSVHGPYQDYYGAALRDKVARRDASVISRHDYTF